MRSILILTFFCFFITANAQQLVVKGKVIDQTSKQPLSFANIRVLNSTLGTAANINGEYRIKTSILEFIDL